MPTQSNVKTLKTSPQPRRTLTPEQEAERAMHLLFDDQFWQDVCAWGVACPQICSSGRYPYPKGKGAPEITYLEALRILDARDRYDLRFRNGRKERQ